MSHVIALDQGTTSSRAIAFDKSGRIQAVSQKEFQQFYPQPGWVEHDPLEIWHSQLEVFRDVVRQIGSPSRTAAVGITNQRETTVVWDRETGQPIHRAIVWQDRRTSERCDYLKAAGHQSTFHKKSGLLLDAYFSGTKVQWILDHVEGARDKANAGELAFGTIDSWLVWNLTGGKLHLTDLSNASRTLLCNIHTCQWDDELLDILNVPRSVLPDICDSSQVVGELDEGLGLSSLPIAGIAGDQQAALFGQQCITPGMVKNTYGTGCFMLMNTGENAVVSTNNLLTTVGWKIGDRVQYALEGSIFTAGSVVKWLRDSMGLISSAAEVESLAASVPDTGDVFLVPAFSGLGAPHWDQYARGSIVGMTLGTTKAHIARAALEGICFQVADVLDSMQSDAGIEISELRVDGGASVNDLLLQIQSNILNTKVLRSEISETTALGAAYLAGLAVGFWKDENEIASQWQIAKRFTPDRSTQNIKDLKQRWKKAVERSKNWLSV